VQGPLGLELLRLDFFLCLLALSLYVYSGILPMSPPDAQVFIVSFSGNEHVCPPLPFPSCSTKPWKWGGEGRWLAIACLHGLSLTTMSTRYASTTVGVLGPTAHPGLPLKVLFWSRAMLPTVARWFMPDARETIDNFVQVRAALRCVIPYVLVWVFGVVGYKRIL
jgi:hypothetical protein